MAALATNNAAPPLDFTSGDLDPLELAERLVSIKFEPNATYPDPPSAAEFSEMPAVREFYFGLATGDPVMLKGSPGVGKSSMIRDLTEAVGLKYVPINAPNVSPEELALPMPTPHERPDGTTEMMLDFMLYKELMDPTPKVVVIEELSRATSQVHNQLMELVQQRRLADIPIPGLVGIFACDNLTSEDGISKQYDLAMADRWSTTVVDPNKTPWRRAVAGMPEFKNIDLSGVYQTYSSLTPRLRYLLSPRTLEHVLWNLLRGNPGVWGLPIIASRRQLLVDENGVDKTDEILDKIAGALRTTNRATVGEPFERALKMAIEHGKNLYVEGPPGIGKTAYVRQICEESGASVLVLSTPVVSPENMVVPFPTDGELDLMLMRWFAEPGPKVLVFDEVWRCSASVRNKVMEILQERTLGGKPIEGLICCIALNNPKEVGGFRMDTGKPDRAQADRFFMSLTIHAKDVPWASHLLNKYGDVAETFLEWWKEGIADDLGRTMITARTLERLIKRHELGMPLENAKVFLNGEFIPVSLHELERMLADRPLARLKSIAAKVDDYVARMSGPDGDNHPAQSEVYVAFLHAELEQLQKSRDVCVQLMRHLNQQYSIALIRSTGKMQQFWFEVLQDARGKGAKK